MSAADMSGKPAGCLTETGVTGRFHFEYLIL